MLAKNGVKLNRPALSFGSQCSHQRTVLLGFRAVTIVLAFGAARNSALSQGLPLPADLNSGEVVRGAVQDALDQYLTALPNPGIPKPKIELAADASSPIYFEKSKNRIFFSPVQILALVLDRHKARSVITALVYHEMGHHAALAREEKPADQETETRGPDWTDEEELECDCLAGLASEINRFHQTENSSYAPPTLEVLREVLGELADTTRFPKDIRHGGREARRYSVSAGVAFAALPTRSEAKIYCQRIADSLVRFVRTTGDDSEQGALEMRMSLLSAVRAAKAAARIGNRPAQAARLSQYERTINATKDTKSLAAIAAALLGDEAFRQDGPLSDR